jgi:hypothetical protein
MRALGLYSTLRSWLLARTKEVEICHLCFPFALWGRIVPYHTRARAVPVPCRTFEVLVYKMANNAALPCRRNC